MINRTARLLLAIVFFYAPAYGHETIAIDNLEDVVQHVTPNSLVIFGGLNTLFKTEDPGRWPYHWNACLDHMQTKNGYHHSVSAAAADLRKIHPFKAKFLPTTAGIDLIIAGIRETNSKIICITRLPQQINGSNINNGITDCLEQRGAVLALDWFDLAVNEQFTTTTPFLNGIIHATNFDLSQLLKDFITFTQDTFDNIIVVDDEDENLVKYGTAADELEISCSCLLFRKLHVAPEGFSLSRDIKDLLPKRKGHRAEEAEKARKKAKNDK
ncbi:DUF2608 domain-containing protein [Candidatus Dependentiae bacterium]|nr:DUF2608 domain-containing protein [Candidatus Dependentiae bacterium]